MPTARSSVTECGGEKASPIAEILGDYAFARNRAFWRGICFSAGIGCMTGVFALGVLNLVTKIPEMWLGSDYSAENVCFGCGKSWWIPIPALTGLIVGSLRYFVMPEKPAGFLTEVIAQHVETKDVPWVVICTCLSLMGGASVGPEAALGALGGGIGVKWAGFRGLSSRETRMNTITGMAGALGSLLPTPLLCVFCLYEMGGSDVFSHFLESVAHSSVAATSSYVVFQSVAERTFLKTDTTLIAGYDLDKHHSIVPKHYVYAFVIGLISSCLGMLTLLIFALVRVVAVKLQVQLGRASVVVLPTLGGLLLGVLTFAFPLTPCEGSAQLPVAIALGRKDESEGGLPVTLLVGTVLAKMLCFSVSAHWGFVGGMMFPNFFIGGVSGVVLHRLWPQVPLLLSVPAMMAAVPGSWMPAPLTLTLLPAFTYILGPQQITPVLLAVVVAYCVSHFLLLGAIVKKGAQSRAAEDREGRKAYNQPPGDADEHRYDRSAVLLPDWVCCCCEKGNRESGADDDGQSSSGAGSAGVHVEEGAAAGSDVEEIDTGNLPTKGDRVMVRDFSDASERAAVIERAALMGTYDAEYEDGTMECGVRLAAITKLNDSTAEQDSAPMNTLHDPLLPQNVGKSKQKQER